MRILFLCLLLMAPAALADGPKKAQALTATLPSPDQVREALLSAEKKLAQREEALAQEKEQLESLRAEIAGMLEKLSQGCPQLQAPAISSVESGDEGQRDEKKRLLQLAESISGMQPEAAAVTLANIPVEVAVKLILAVESKKAGKILSQMPPEKAAQLITAVLLSRQEAAEQKAPAAKKVREEQK
jgi:flagellar motility protein MotE (MotC chaperone)